MIEKITVGILISAVSGLFVYAFITNRSRLDIIKDAGVLVTEAVKTHLSIEHKLPMFSIIEKHVEECDASERIIEINQKFDNHVRTCSAPQNVQELQNQLNIIKVSLIFLVRNAGGNPDDLGLRL